MVTEERVIKIFEKDSDLYNFEGDNAFEGLKIIAKYTKNIVQGADHDVIYSESIEKLIEAGMTENEFEQLRKMNWMIEDDSYLACFV
jgi:hypothetical protein